jgi:hypothetical protein
MPTFLRAAGMSFAILLTCSAPVRAQTPIELTPPAALGSTEVPYPEGADGDAAVVLELVVEKDGSVSSATVVEGAEPFAERARATALTWRFTPAQRGPDVVAARPVRPPRPSPPPPPCRSPRRRLSRPWK